jgi:hypothetical protein
MPLPGGHFHDDEGDRSENMSGIACEPGAVSRLCFVIDDENREAQVVVPGAEAIHPIKLTDVDPQAWLADVLARLPDHPAERLDELLP